MVSTDGHVTYKAHYQHSQEEKMGHSDVCSLETSDHTAETPQEILVSNDLLYSPYKFICT